MSEEEKTPDQPQPTNSNSLVGRTFGGRYRIIDQLGHGGMGIVYRAEHTLLERTVALKVLHSALAENTEYLERFKREALVASRLSHPNAITLYDFGIEDRAPYFVMQYVEGNSLKQVLINEGPLTLERINTILQQVGGALREAHKLGIVHRDLKPDNIMVSKDSDGFEKSHILDFGIAKPLNNLGDATAANLTHAGMFMGTPQYMSPEQAVDRPCDQRADIYALGIIAYEMITGEVPFKSHSPVEMLFKHLHEVPTPIREFKPELHVPEAVSEAVQRALAKSPDERYQRVEDFVAAFSAAVSGKAGEQGVCGVPASPPSQKAAAAERREEQESTESASASSTDSVSPITASQSEPSTLTPSSAKQKNSTKVVALGVGALLLAGGGAFLFSNRGGEEKSAELQTVLTRSAADESARVTPVPTPSQLNTALPNAVSTDTATTDTATQGTPSPTPLLDGANLANALKGAAAALSQGGGTEDGKTPGADGALVANGAQPISGSGVDSATVPTDASGNPLPAQAVPPTTPTEPLDPILSLSLGALTQSAAQGGVQGGVQKGSNADVESLYQEGQKLSAEKAFQQAGEKYRQALLIRPSHIRSRLSLGVSLIRLGRPDLAYEHFREADKIQPNYPPTIYNIASYYAITNDAPRAVEELRRAINMFPKMKSWLATDPDFDNIRSDPEFQKLAN